eukprot:jgi/Bigna1/77334/fgenesh1_pg.47_\
MAGNGLPCSLCLFLVVSISGATEWVKFDVFETGTSCGNYVTTVYEEIGVCIESLKILGVSHRWDSSLGLTRFRSEGCQFTPISKKEYPRGTCQDEVMIVRGKKRAGSEDISNFPIVGLKCEYQKEKLGHTLFGVQKQRCMIDSFDEIGFGEGPLNSDSLQRVHCSHGDLVADSCDSGAQYSLESLLGYRVCGLDNPSGIVRLNGCDTRVFRMMANLGLDSSKNVFAARAFTITSVMIAIIITSGLIVTTMGVLTLTLHRRYLIRRLRRSSYHHQYELQQQQQQQEEEEEGEEGGEDEKDENTAPSSFATSQTLVGAVSHRLDRSEATAGGCNDDDEDDDDDDNDDGGGDGDAPNSVMLSTLSSSHLAPSVRERSND